MEEIFNTSQPKREDILYVCSILKIKTRKQKESELCESIKDKIINTIKDRTNLIICFLAHGSKLPAAAEYKATMPMKDNKITTNIKRMSFIYFFK